MCFRHISVKIQPKNSLIGNSVSDLIGRGIKTGTFVPQTKALLLDLLDSNIYY